MLVTYDFSADAAYIYLQQDSDVARSVLIDDERTVDLDHTDAVVGIEILLASEGFKLDDIIDRFRLQDRRAELLQAVKEFRPAATV